MCPVLWLTSALYLIFPLVTFLSNFKNKQKNWLDAMAPSVNSNIRLGTRLPFDPALPEISTLWLALNRFIFLKRADASSICEGNSGNTGNCSYLSSYQSASPTWILTWAEYCRSNCVCESSYCGSECIWTPLDDAEGLLDAGVPWSRISADWQQKYDDVVCFFLKEKKSHSKEQWKLMQITCCLRCISLYPTACKLLLGCSWQRYSCVLW